MSPSLNPVFAEALRPFAPASSEVHAIAKGEAASATTLVAKPSYFVVMIDYGRRGLEAVVDPEITERGVIARLQCGEYTNVGYIHHVHDGVVEDVTDALFARAGLGQEEAA